MRKQSQHHFLAFGTGLQGKSEISSRFSRRTIMPRNLLGSDISQALKVAISQAYRIKGWICQLWAHLRTELKQRSH